MLCPLVVQPESKFKVNCLANNISNLHSPEYKIPVSQILHEVMENHRVHVLGELHQDEPVAEPELLHHDGHITSIAGF